MVLIIDTNEKDIDDLVRMLKERNIEFTFQTLHVGDYRVQYIIAGVTNAEVVIIHVNIGIEKKAIDFYNSAISGLLLEQCYRMTTSFYHSILIIEGNMYDHLEARQGVPKKFLNMIFVKAMFQRAIDGAGGAISIIHTADYHETALTLINIHELIRDEENLWTLPVIPTTKVNKNVKYLIVHILKSFPNVGGKRAKTLLAYFLTFEAVMKATQEELMEVSGIGAKIAEGIINTRSFIYE